MILPPDDKAEKVYGHFWSKLDVCQYRVTRLSDRLKACQLHQLPVNLFWHFVKDEFYAFPAMMREC